MADGNPYAKYVTPKAGANPYAKYVTQQAAPAPTGPLGPRGENPMLEPSRPPGANDPVTNPAALIGAPAAPPPVNGLYDALASFQSGAVRGLAETIMLPVTADRMMESGVGWGMNQIEDLGRYAFGLDPRTPEMQAGRDAANATLFPATAGLRSAQDSVRGAMDENLYAPQTRAGRFAETAGEFAIPGGVPGKAVLAAPTIGRMAKGYLGDLFRNVAIPAGISEGAGQGVEALGGDGTWVETAARGAGAFAGGVGAAAAKAAHAPDIAIRRGIGDMTEADWQRALDLQNNRFGVRLTGPEAIAQARNGATGLTDVQRVVEGSLEGQTRMAGLFEQRPEQLKAATQGWLDSIAPQSAAPSTLGPRASDAATTAIRDVEKQRSAATAPLYAAADRAQVPVDQVQGIIDDINALAASDKTGILGGPVTKLRDMLMDPAGNVITDIENLDRVRKFVRDKMDLPQIGQDAITGEQNAAVSGFLDRLNGVMEANSPDFVAAKGLHADMTRNVVQPVAEGPLGAVAASRDTSTVGNALLPLNPLTGSEAESADAVRRLVAQDADTTRGTVRQTLGDRFSSAMTETQRGDASFGGAKFRKVVAGNDQRDATLTAVLDALGMPEAANAAPELLDVMQATGRRKPIGSATEFNRSLNADLGTASPAARGFDLMKSVGASWLTTAGDGLRRAALRSNTGTLADMFTDPNSVELIRAAVARGAVTGIPEAIARVAAQLAVSGGK